MANRRRQVASTGLAVILIFLLACAEDDGVGDLVPAPTPTSYIDTVYADASADSAAAADLSYLDWSSDLLLRSDDLNNDVLALLEAEFLPQDQGTANLLWIRAQVLRNEAQDHDVPARHETSNSYMVQAMETYADAIELMIDGLGAWPFGNPDAMEQASEKLVVATALQSQSNIALVVEKSE